MPLILRQPSVLELERTQLDGGSEAYTQKDFDAEFPQWSRSQPKNASPMKEPARSLRDISASSNSDNISLEGLVPNPLKDHAAAAPAGGKRMNSEASIGPQSLHSDRNDQFPRPHSSYTSSGLTSHLYSNDVQPAFGIAGSALGEDVRTKKSEYSDRDVVSGSLGSLQINSERSPPNKYRKLEQKCPAPAGVCARWSSTRAPSPSTWRNSTLMESKLVADSGLAPYFAAAQHAIIGPEMAAQNLPPRKKVERQKLLKIPRPGEPGFIGPLNRRGRKSKGEFSSSNPTSPTASLAQIDHGEDNDSDFASSGTTNPNQRRKCRPRTDLQSENSHKPLPFAAVPIISQSVDAGDGTMKLRIKYRRPATQAVSNAIGTSRTLEVPCPHLTRPRCNSLIMFFKDFVYPAIELLMHHHRGSLEDAEMQMVGLDVALEVFKVSLPDIFLTHDDLEYRQKNVIHQFVKELFCRKLLVYSKKEGYKTSTRDELDCRRLLKSEDKPLNELSLLRADKNRPSSASEARGRSLSGVKLPPGGQELGLKCEPHDKSHFQREIAVNPDAGEKRDENKFQRSVPFNVRSEHSDQFGEHSKVTPQYFEPVTARAVESPRYSNADHNERPGIKQKPDRHSGDRLDMLKTCSSVCDGGAPYSAQFASAGRNVLKGAQSVRVDQASKSLDSEISGIGHSKPIKHTSAFQNQGYSDIHKTPSTSKITHDHPSGESPLQKRASANFVLEDPSNEDQNQDQKVLHHLSHSSPLPCQDASIPTPRLLLGHETDMDQLRDIGLPRASTEHAEGVGIAGDSPPATNKLNRGIKKPVAKPPSQKKTKSRLRLRDLKSPFDTDREASQSTHHTAENSHGRAHVNERRAASDLQLVSIFGSLGSTETSCGLVPYKRSMNYKIKSVDTHGTIKHAGFTDFEREAALASVEGIFSMSPGSTQFPTQSQTVTTRLHNAVHDLSEPQIQDVARRCQSKAEFSSRKERDVAAFLSNIKAGNDHDTSIVRVEGTAIEPDPQPNIDSLLRQRELGTQCGGRHTQMELRYKQIDGLRLVGTWKGASGDIVAAGWSSDSQSYAVGATATSDPEDLQYNRPNNLLFGNINHNTLHELPDHRIARPLPHTIASGPNTSAAVYDACDPVVYKTVEAVKFSPTDGVLYSGSHDNTVKVWDINNKLPKCTETLIHDAQVTALEASTRLANTFATASHSIKAPIRIYRQQENRYVHTVTLESERARQKPHWQILPECLRWGLVPINQQILLAGFSRWGDTSNNDPAREGDLCLWDATTAQKLRVIPAAHNIFTAAFHPFLDAFSTGGAPGSKLTHRYTTRSVVRTWDGRSVSMACECECPALDMQDLVFHPREANILAVGCTDGAAYIWDIRKPDYVLHRLEHGEPIADWDHKYGDPPLNREQGDGGVNMTLWGAGRNHLYTGATDGMVKCWNISRAPEDTLIRDVAELPAGVSCGSFSPDHSTLLVGDCTGGVHLLSSDQGPRAIQVDAGDSDAEDLGPQPIEFTPAPREEMPKKPHELGEGQQAARELLQSGQLVVDEEFGVGQGPAYKGPYAMYAHKEGSLLLLREYEKKQPVSKNGRVRDNSATRNIKGTLAKRREELGDVQSISNIVDLTSPDDDVVMLQNEQDGSEVDSSDEGLFEDDHWFPHMDKEVFTKLREKYPV